MLILSRKTDENIIINGNIEISVKDISGDRVRLAITAPKNVPILRGELLATVELNKEAAKTSTISVAAFAAGINKK